MFIHTCILHSTQGRIQKISEGVAVCRGVGDYDQKTVFKAYSRRQNSSLFVSTEKKLKKRFTRGWRSPDRLPLDPPLIRLVSPIYALSQSIHGIEYTKFLFFLFSSFSLSLKGKQFEMLKKDDKFHRKREEELNKDIFSLFKEGLIDQRLRFQLQSTCSSLSVFYGLPKVHKTGFPIRPIISTIGSYQYQLS
jgi:hypothetical protein